MKSRKPIIAIAVSAAGLAAITAYEGFSSEAYQPVPGDKWTIGFGTTEDVHPGDTMTMEEALQRARQDITKYQGYLAKCVKVPLTQYELDAYLSFVYNVGPTAFCRSTLVVELNKGHYEHACKELKKWVCGPDPTGQYAKRYPNHHCGPGKAPIPGLVARREAEYQRCMGVGK